VHEELGWNYRMTNLQAALGLAQLERLDEFVERKRAMGHRYTEGLRVLSWVQLPLAKIEYAENIYWVYGLVLSDSVPIDAAEAMLWLAQARIGSRPFFWPMHEQPALRRRGLFPGVRCPHAERLARRGFYLPSGLGLNAADIDRVIAAIRSLHPVNS
jgi:perosamine synthetase